jgi:hypothetical protein
LSRPEETIIKSESGIGLRQKGEKKYRFNPPAGTLILTDERLIFARSGGELGKRLFAGGFGILGAGALLRSMTKINPEELDKALEKPESFQLKLQDISEVKTERMLGSALLSVQCPNAAERPKVQFYREGAVSPLRGFDQWIEATNLARVMAKQRETIPPTPRQASPSYYAPAPGPVTATPPQRPETTSSSSPPTSPQVEANMKFCMHCGAQIPESNSFCGVCGQKQE